MPQFQTSVNAVMFCIKLTIGMKERLAQFQTSVNAIIPYIKLTTGMNEQLERILVYMINLFHNFISQIKLLPPR